MVNDVIAQLYKVVQNRKENPEEGSYTCYLFEKGLDKILKKCGEECTEMVIAAKNNDNEELKMKLQIYCIMCWYCVYNKGLNGMKFMQYWNNAVKRSVT